MRTYTFSKWFTIALGGLSILVIFGWFSIIRISSISIYNSYTDTYMTINDKLPFLIVFAIALLTWTISLVSMIYQWLIIKMSIKRDETHMYDFLIGGIFLAFIVIIPIKKVKIEHLDIQDESVVFFGNRIKKEHAKSYSILHRTILRLKSFNLVVLFQRILWLSSRKRI
jgi:hypothetical protein